ncbi:MAG: prepilin-type N-terminal cleavage/methylation domain-containing protein [Candidatus Zixiibacteriota bacterium]
MFRITINNHGFSLMEVLVLIVVIGIVASTAMQWMTSSIDDIRRAKTEREMEMLASAITGNPDQISNGVRSDFGYIGDIGSFPPNLQALYQNPGGYSAWNGPYLSPGFLQDSTGFKYDEWGTAYTYSGGVTITSTGSGSTISKKIADSPTDYLLNQFNGTITDSAGEVPGSSYRDSVAIIISIPDGTGGIQTKTYRPNPDGTFTLDSLPVGKHPLNIIYTPAVDTIYRYLTILPRHKSEKSYKFAGDYFSEGGGGSGSGVEILRPEGDGSASNLNTQNCVSNWQCVDEVTADDDTTCVEGYGSQWNEDLYNTQDHAAGTGTIDSVIIYVRAIGNSGGRKARTLIRTGGSSYSGSQNNTTGSYVNYSTTYATNPGTSSSWTWTEIDNIEIGVDLKKDAYCTQVWLEVYYTY